MPIHFTTSHSLSALCDALCDQLRQSPSHVFAPWVMVTQTEGMNNWLRQQMADCMGIAANCNFYQPNRLLNQLFFWADGRYDDEVLSRYHLVWLLYDLLEPQGEFARRFPLVAAYYQGNGSELKQAALASTLADLFDQYQVYRSDMVALWREGRRADANNATEQWQQWLWLKAWQTTKDKLPDKSAIANILLQKLKVPAIQDNLRRRVPRIHLFGLSVLTEWHIKILHELGKVVDLHFYLLNPAPEVFWIKDKSRKFIQQLSAAYAEGEQPVVEGNALLTGMGGLLQNTFGMLFQYDVFLNNYQVVGQPPPAPNTLLQALQWDVFHNAVHNRSPLSEAMLKDGSVVVVNAYTRVREIEVLYNHLLHLKTQGQLHSREVVVMVTNIEEYAPYISAVFDNGPLPIAYKIADANPAEDNGWMGALRALLQLSDDPFSAEEVLSLLDYPALRRYFGLHNLPLLRHYLRQSGIRSGIEGNEAYETHLIGWKHGLQRLLLGVAMSGDAWVETPAGTGFEALDLAEGQAADDIVRLCRFADWLMQMLAHRKGQKTVAQWIEVVKELVAQLQPREEEEEEADEELAQSLREMMDLLKRLEPGKVAALGQSQTKVSWAVFSAELLGELNNVKAAHQFGRGGVTFCSLIPMRSIPFAFVAMLGLDASSFPRLDVRPHYDLMRQRRLGDRSLRDNDRHLFLENLMAARQCFYLSYVGQSTKDGSTLNASVVVEELLDYVAAGLPRESQHTQVVQQHLVQPHPLHNFSERYNSEATGWHNWLRQRQAERSLFDESNNSALKEANPDTASLSADVVLLKQLHLLLKNAPQLFYEKQMQVRFQDEETLIPDWEPTAPNYLQQWQLRKALQQTSALEKQRRLQALKERGLLPLASAGLHVVDKLEQELAAAAALLPAELQDLSTTVLPVELVLPSGLTIKGQLPDLVGHVLARTTHSKSADKHLLAMALDALVWSATGASGELCFVQASDAARAVIQKPIPAADKSLEMLEQLAQIYQQSFVVMNGFSTQFFSTATDNSSLATLVSGAMHNDYHPVEDPYLLAAWKDGAYKPSSASLQAMEALWQWALEAMATCGFTTQKPPSSQAL